MNIPDARKRLAQVEAQIIARRARLPSMGAATRQQVIAYKREADALAKELAALRSQLSRVRT